MFGPTYRLLWPDGRSEKVALRSIGKSGGAGEIFEVEHRPHYVAKLYHAVTKPEQLEKYSRKIRWMVANKPELPPIPAGVEGVVQLAWPVAQVLRDNRFAGFLMEKIDFSRTLELDYLLTRRQAEAEGVKVDFGKLVTVCYNLASLLNSLHRKRIAVVDLKPMNLKVYKSELYVSILDCDGFCIYADSFHSDAPQVTPEYLAPEFHGVAVTHPESQDWFALATIIFRLLNYGIHPYVGVSDNRLQYPPELASRIQLGLYPYGHRTNVGARPAPASVHEAFPDSLRLLFDRAFGWASGGRPSAFEWAQSLAAYASRHSIHMGHCERGHVQFSGKPCATCLREHILQRHVRDSRRLGTRLRAAPRKTLQHVKKSLHGTHSSPFQATLAQMQQSPVRIIYGPAPTGPAIPLAQATRHAVALEILWLVGLAITVWWLR
ncbi:MAG: DNA-binding protein [Betaproteobacteria bacterium]|nr:DNA-binding protein [Betaproteobacteria bacterium]MDE2212738.1 DNA-binding protein [Betaproteobacteria bacterium]